LAKKVLVISTDRDWGSDLKRELSRDKELDATFLAVRKDVVEYLNLYTYDCIVAHGVMGEGEITVLMKTVVRNKKNCDTRFYVASDDFNLFHELTMSTPLDEIFAINLPQTFAEIYDQLHQFLFPPKTPDQEGGQTKKEGGYDFDMAFINVFIGATKKVIKEMGMLDGEVKTGKPRLLAQVQDKIKVSIRAKLVMSSPYFQGSFFISFPKPTFLKLYNTILGEKHTEISDEIADFASELANIIYGQSKKELNMAGYELKMAIPAVDKTPQLKSKFPIIAIPFSCSAGNFFVKIAPNLL